jgi:drug/metabolite transporter (DMT)-like permease
MAGASRRLPSWELFAGAVLIWSTTWHAILYQLAETSPEVGVAWRFSVAGLLALAIAAWRGDRVRCNARQHGLLAVQGIFMYSLAYLSVYHAEQHVPTGLVAVGYSAAPLVSGIGAWLLWRQPISARFVGGGLLCVVGVTLIFMPEFGRVADSDTTLRGALFTLAALLFSSAGSLAASRNAQYQLPFWPALGWGMWFGAALSWLVALASGQSFHWPAAASWWLSLAYLSLAGSVVAFACFLALQQRVGPGPASTVSVMTPVLALVVSAALEGFQPVLATWLGAALAVAGNVMILHRTTAPATADVSR